MSNVIEPVLNFYGPQYFKVEDYTVNIVSKLESGFPETIEVDISLGRTKLADKVVEEDIKWVEEKGFNQYFTERIETSDGFESVFSESAVTEQAEKIKKVNQNISETFSNDKNSNVYGRKNVLEDLEIILTDKGRGEWR